MYMSDEVVKERELYKSDPLIGKIKQMLISHGECVVSFREFDIPYSDFVKKMYVLEDEGFIVVQGEEPCSDRYRISLPLKIEF